MRLIIMSENNNISIPDLPPIMRHSILRRKNILKTIEEVEIEHIKEVLNFVKGNKTKASEILGIDRKTLREKLKNNKKLS